MALVSILIIHFNATVTGYFTLPHKLFASVLPFGIYLGDFGSSLFFIVSGAALALTVPDNQSPATFYKKRAKAIYPLFWLAWAICFSLRFLEKPGYYAAAKSPTLLLTVLGLDNFAVAAGWVGVDFACVGEWFLGSILFLYLLFPLLFRGLRRKPWLTWMASIAICLMIHLAGWDAHLVAIHVLEFLFGMQYLQMTFKGKVGVSLLCAVGTIFLAGFDSKITCALFSVMIFAVLAGVSRFLEYPWMRILCARLAKISYAVFLVHHVLIQRMAEQFDLAALSRRDTAFLFLIYLMAVWAAAEALLWLQRCLQKGVTALRAAA
ncbi:hypothetical protein SUBVAR_05039 [Subdoligranulum variabile DSM 15176]|uniref:Acyltransferase 3 domain-containing protein n=1 Tax=Subdoligranulum variabile DSM 15176 TaxID=411471 RepID=D1PL04_9FIRM|nr:hypothetical protein SUBVAR_05039 [Subdoligranulum variabile DSM 15176]